MKQYKYLVAAIVLMTGMASCKKTFLDDVSNRRNLLRQSYVTNLNAVSEYLNGIYANVGNALVRDYHMIYPDLVADNIKPIVGSSGSVPLGFHYNWKQQVDETSTGQSISSNGLNCNVFSYQAYLIARSCSYVIEKASEFAGNSMKADTLKGQAYALRAFTHFMLVNYFAQSYNFTADGSHPGIVLALSSDWTAPVARRNTVAEVYTSLIDDLNNAIALLPATSTIKIRMNRNAAIALLARVQLFKGDYVQAKNLARQVLASVPIMTVNYPADLFTPSEKEALFQVPPAIGTVDGYVTRFASFYFRSSVQFRATTDIVNLLTEDPNDVRKVWVTPVSTNWNIVKFPSGKVAGITPPENAYYLTMLRSSEMCLTAAEAYAQLNNADSARYFLDTIRHRANPAAPASTADGAALLEEIYKERRKELAFEGLRMFDLLRWKKSVHRNDALTPAATDLPYPSNKAIAPLPGLDVKVNGLVQNLDY